jgi:hypothetical protein
MSRPGIVTRAQDVCVTRRLRSFLTRCFDFCPAPRNICGLKP